MNDLAAGAITLEAELTVTHRLAQHIVDTPYAEIQQKFDECFRLGVGALDTARTELLTQRVREVEAIEDIVLFLKDIS